MQFDEAEMTGQGGTCAGFVSSDNESIGYMGADYLCSLIDEGSQAAIVQGIAGNPSSEARTSGATKAFEDKGIGHCGQRVLRLGYAEGSGYRGRLARTVPRSENHL